MSSRQRKLRVASIVGARPQFIKAAPVSRELRKRHEEILIHTGQHYDPKMSSEIFAGCGLADPDINLGVGSGPHGRQTAAILEGTETALQQVRPDVVIVYGDTNSTLGGALAAVKLGIPVAHVEAGLRCRNRYMPEEINRVLTDHLAELLLCPTENAASNLRAEGITEGVEVVGDVMVDALRLALERVDGEGILSRMGLRRRGFVLLTIHRAGTADSPTILQRILEAVDKIGVPVVFPAHPRTAATLQMQGPDVGAYPNIRLVEPLGHSATVALEAAARCVVTDSGGVQKEAYLLGTPCVTLRDRTEWTETLHGGWNRLAGTDPKKILEAAAAPPPAEPRREAFGDGHAAERVVDAVTRRFAS